MKKGIKQAGYRESEDTEEKKTERIQVRNRAGEDTEGNKTVRILERNRAGQDTEKEQSSTGYRTGVDQKRII